MPEIRKDINALAGAELDDYLHALDILRQRSEVNEDDPTAPRNSETTSPDEALLGFASQPKNKISEFTGIADLDDEYKYEYTEQLKAAFGVPLTPAFPVPLKLPATELLSPLDANVDLVTELRDQEVVQLGFKVPETKGQQLRVRLDELKVPNTGSHRLRAFRHPPEVPFQSDDGEFARRFGAGSVSESLGADGSDLVFTLRFIPAPSATGLLPHPLAPLDEVDFVDVRTEVYS